ncbi:exocyst complex component 3-like [Cotesia glomerata]|uniref:exocyst complex component 3-like n=1 Tax=Cotesia glomerata TaxID=32391 RepID=UPI001D015B74|nr:exocyst complex component 3-like [Cotesia glomerata]
MAYRSIDDIGSRQLRNRLNRLRENLNDLNENIEQIIPDEARNENEMLNDGLQGWNNEIIFPAVYMDNQNADPIFHREERIEILEDQFNVTDESSSDESDYQPDINNDGNDSDDEDDIDNENDRDDEDEPAGGNDNQNRRNNYDINQNQPLFDGDRITVGDSMLTILSLLLSHNLSMACIEDIIKAIELHCLPNGLKKIVYSSLRNIFNLKKPISLNIITASFVLENLLMKMTNVHRVSKKNSYFVQLPIISQLQEMYKRQDFYERLQFRFQRPIPLPGTITDIYDGELYREWFNNGFLSNPNNISFSWYTDGIPVYKSSHISIWPFYLTINELPFNERKKERIHCS